MIEDDAEEEALAPDSEGPGTSRRGPALLTDQKLYGKIIYTTEPSAPEVAAVIQAELIRRAAAALDA